MGFNKQFLADSFRDIYALLHVISLVDWPKHVKPSSFSLVQSHHPLQLLTHHASPVQVTVQQTCRSSWLVPSVPTKSKMRWQKLQPRLLSG